MRNLVQIPSTHVKAEHDSTSVTQCWGGQGDRQIPGAHQPASLAERAPAALSFIVLNKAGSP